MVPIKLYREFLIEELSKQYEWCTIIIDDQYLHIIFKTTEYGILNEARHRGMPVGGKYSIQFHKSHADFGMDHLHAYEKNNQLFALNINGTAHDRSHGIEIPNKLVKGIRKFFPNFVLPPNNIIEWSQLDIEMNVKFMMILG